MFGWGEWVCQMKIRLSQPSLAGAGAGAELGKRPNTIKFDLAHILPFIFTFEFTD